MQSILPGISAHCCKGFWTVDEANSFVKSQGKSTPAALRCAISRDLMTDPVRTQHGGCYERSHMLGWLQVKKTDPLTNLKLTSEVLTPHEELKNATEAFRKFCVEQYPGCEGLFETRDSAQACDGQIAAKTQDDAPLTQEARRALIAANRQEILAVHDRMKEHEREVRCAYNAGERERYYMFIEALASERVRCVALESEDRRQRALLHGLPPPPQRVTSQWAALTWAAGRYPLES